MQARAQKRPRRGSHKVAGDYAVLPQDPGIVCKLQATPQKCQPRAIHSSAKEPRLLSCHDLDYKIPSKNGQMS
jgi:hypothetical protein